MVAVVILASNAFSSGRSNSSSNILDNPSLESKPTSEFEVEWNSYESSSRLSFNESQSR